MTHKIYLLMRDEADGKKLEPSARLRQKYVMLQIAER